MTTTLGSDIVWSIAIGVLVPIVILVVPALVREVIHWWRHWGPLWTALTLLSVVLWILRPKHSRPVKWLLGDRQSPKRVSD